MKDAAENGAGLMNLVQPLGNLLGAWNTSVLPWCRESSVFQNMMKPGLYIYPLSPGHTVFGCRPEPVIELPLDWYAMTDIITAAPGLGIPCLLSFQVQSISSILIQPDLWMDTTMCTSKD